MREGIHAPPRTSSETAKPNRLCVRLRSRTTKSLVSEKSDGAFFVSPLSEASFARVSLMRIRVVNPARDAGFVDDVRTGMIIFRIHACGHRTEPARSFERTYMGTWFPRFRINSLSKSRFAHNLLLPARRCPSRRRNSLSRPPFPHIYRLIRKATPLMPYGEPHSYALCPQTMTKGERPTLADFEIRRQK